MRKNAMDAFCDNYGILKGWIAANCGFPFATFNDILWYRGFRAEEAEVVESFLNKRGKELLKFRFTDNSNLDIERLRTAFGIKKAFLAEKLNVSTGSFLNIVNIRNGGFTQTEKTILSEAVKEVAEAMIAFELPKNMKKAA